MMKKILKLCFACMLIFTMMNPAYLFAAKSEDEAQLLVDTFVLQDENKKPLPNGSDVSLSDTFQIGFVYTVDNVEDIDETLKYRIPLPANLSWAKDKLGNEEIPIHLSYLDSEGIEKKAILGNLSLQGDSLVLQYTQGIRDTLLNDGLDEINLDVRDVNLFCKLDKEAIKDAKEVEIVLSNTEKVTFHVKENQDVLPSIKQKSATFENGILSWTVTINPGKPEYKDVLLEDVISENQTYLADTFRVDGQLLSAQINDQTLHYLIPSIDKDELTITYQTKPKNTLWVNGTMLKDMNASFDNKATLVIDGKEISKKEATIQGQSPWISKTGKKLDNENAILWTLTINAPQHALENVTIYDVITNGDMFLEMPEKLIHMTDGSEISFTKGFTYDGTTYEPNKALSFQFAKLDKEITVTYKTPIKNEYYEVNNTALDFKNKAWITTDWNPDGEGYTPYTLENGSIKTSSVPVPSSLLKKTAGSYNPATQEITWDIQLNANNVNVTSAIVEDRIPDNQEVVRFDGLDECGVEPVVSADRKKITYDFGNIGKTQHTFQITTKVIDKDFIASNREINVKNGVELTYTLSNDIDKHTVVSNAVKKISSNMLKKKGTTYDYATHEQTWELTLNENAMIVKDAFIEDRIPDFQTLCEDRIVLDGQVLDSDTTKANYYELNGQTLRIYVMDNEASQTIHKKHQIEYKTIVQTQEDIRFQTEKTVRLQNTATLQMDNGAYPNVTVSASKDINNSLLQKTADTKDLNTDGLVHYAISLNPNKASLTHQVILDTMSNGLQLDLDSLHIYYANVDANGSMTKKEVVQEGSYTYEYTAKDNENILTLKFEKPISDAYIVEYDADVSGKGLLNNRIAFEGEDSSQTSHAEVSVSGSASANATARKGKVTVTLFEEGTRTPLPDVSFMLKYNGNVVQQLKTDKEGNIKLELLNLRKDYQLIQTSVLDGYHKEDMPLLINVPSKDIVEKELYNSPVTADIQFYIKNENEETLKGGEFQLFEKAANGNTAPLLETTSDEEGLVNFPNMRMNTYRIHQESSPEGYQMMDDLYATVDKTGAVEIKDADDNLITNITNLIRDDYGYLQLHVEDDEKNPISNASFTMMDENGREQSLQSDELGNIKTTPLKFGEYTIIQNTTKDGYELSEEVRVDHSSSTTLITIVNKKIVEPIPPVVDPTPTPTVPKPNKKPDNKKPVINTSPESPKTSDTSTANLFIIGLFLSGGLLAITIRLKRNLQQK